MALLFILLQVSKYQRHQWQEVGQIIYVKKLYEIIDRHNWKKWLCMGEDLF